MTSDQFSGAELMKHKNKNKVKRYTTSLGMILTILVLFLIFPIPAQAQQCTCTASITVNTLGAITAGVAGIDLAAICTGASGSFSDDTCTGATGLVPAADENACQTMGVDGLLAAFGLPSSFTTFGSVEGLSCAWEAAEETTQPDETKPTSTPQSTPSGTTSTFTLRFPNPLGTLEGALILGRVLQLLTGFMGGIALLVFIWGGFLWLTSGGNVEKIKKAQSILVWAVLGLAVIAASYIIVRFIVTALATGAGVIGN